MNYNGQSAQIGYMENWDEIMAREDLLSGSVFPSNAFETSGHEIYFQCLILKCKRDWVGETNGTGGFGDIIYTANGKIWVSGTRIQLSSAKRPTDPFAAVWRPLCTH